MKTIIPYSDINPSNASRVGAKAHRLAQIHQHGFKTSPFFVIPSDVYDHKVLTSKQEYEILTEASKFKRLSYAVRSSANCEDGISASFAGQFTSYLSLKLDEIIPSIHKCWNSVETESVRSYCDFHQVDHNTIKMSVIVQEMIPADKGGVLFTTDPFQNRKLMVVEAARGLGEQIVTGTVNSSKYILDKKTGKLKGEVIGLNESVLSQINLNKIFQIGRKLEQLFCYPQDIEWAIYHDELFILQTRPIT